ncbi:biotin--[acetyl-CoA-carboxylase] ligase [Rhodobacteraceae bacterium RKSG542]|uniref:biotin--[acetyl-CoA-carboxylase] ligase n=1 Tax=Pseudovibrio flavus TaxID=2529854 RepID=UPI0012BC01FB|nr:biotin--[acetyl-CoA-carboxylase] ligase [Pseudovibrio flavus]MTI16847.1 biotin--[acetyl-CoA-carboxylase] ligase [Pseudovibrio flavus]
MKMLSYGLNRQDGKVIYYLKTTGSTNRVVCQLAKFHEGETVVVVADHQTSGRGKGERIWYSHPGDSLCFSVLLRPNVEIERIYQVTLVAAVAVHEAIQSVCGLSAGIKWPNDLLINGKKCCGILSELQMTEMNEVDYVVVGIGINVSQQFSQFNSEVSHRATSLSIESGGYVDRMEVFSKVIDRIDFRISEWGSKGFSPCYEIIKKNSHSVGRSVTINTGIHEISGSVDAICSDGSILIKDQKSIYHQLHYGELI